MKKKIENIKDLLIVAQSNKDKGDLPGSLNVLNEVLNLDPDNKKALNLLDWKPIYTYDNMVYDSWNSFSNNL